MVDWLVQQDEVKVGTFSNAPIRNAMEQGIYTPGHIYSIRTNNLYHVIIGHWDVVYCLLKDPRVDPTTSSNELIRLAVAGNALLKNKLKDKYHNDLMEQHKILEQDAYQMVGIFDVIYNLLTL